MSGDTGETITIQEQLVLEQRARDLASREGRRRHEISGDLAMVTFSLGRERYGVELSYLQEVRPLQALRWSIVPGTPSFVVGVVSLRGRLYSFINLADFLGAGSLPISDQAHVLLVAGGKQPHSEVMVLGLISDDLPRIMRLDFSQLQEPLGTVSSEAQKYFKGVTRETISLLDIDNLLSDPAIIVG